MGTEQGAGGPPVLRGVGTLLAGTNTGAAGESTVTAGEVFSVVADGPRLVDTKELSLVVLDL